MIKTIIITIITSSGIISILTGAILKKFKRASVENESLRYGVQALLRHELYELYHYWTESKGYAPIAAKEDFDNMYKRYHALGVNGVMDGIHEEFMNLPTSEKGDGK